MVSPAITVYNNEMKTSWWAKILSIALISTLLSNSAICSNIAVSRTALPIPIWSAQAFSLRSTSFHWLARAMPCLAGLFRTYSEASHSLTPTSSRPVSVLLISSLDLDGIGGMESFLNVVQKKLREGPWRVYHISGTSDPQPPANAWIGSAPSLNPKVLQRPFFTLTLDFFRIIRDVYQTGSRIIRYEKESAHVVLHLHTPFHIPFVLATWALSIRYHVPRVLTSHEAGTLYANYPKLGYVVSQVIRILSIGSYISGVSKASTLHFLGAAHLTAMGIPLEYFSPSLGSRDEFLRKYGKSAERPHGVSRDALLLFDPSRILPAKGQADFLILADRLKRMQRQEGLYAQVVLMGSVNDERYHAYILQEIKKRNLQDYLVVLPPGTPEDVRNGDAASYLALNPTRTEAISLTLIEAAAMGVPSVSYRVGGVPEVVQHGGTGFLAAPGNVNEFCDYVQQFIRDEALRGEMSVAAMDYARTHFSMNGLIHRWLHFYAWVAETPAVDRLAGRPQDQLRRAA